MQRNIMKRLFTTILALAVISTTTAFADDTDALAGKWTLEKANDQGQSLTRMLEIKKNKFEREYCILMDTKVPVYERFQYLYQLIA